MKCVSQNITGSLHCGESILFFCTHTPIILATQRFITLVLLKAMARLPELEGNTESQLPEGKEMYLEWENERQDIVKQEDFSELQSKEFETKKTLCLRYIGS